MLITFFRSSSYNCYDMCPHKYFLSYVLGIKERANKAADVGSITHKALELLAWRKLAEQSGQTQFDDNDIGKFSCAEMTPDYAIELAFYHYTKVKPTIHTWDAKDFKTCRKHMYVALEWNDGMWSPLKRKVLSPEQHFDFCIEEPWAEYHYKLPNGEKLDGYLGLKGTVDLVLDAESNVGSVIEYCDWKTGARKDWATGKEKTYEKLRDDPQLRIYHYALSRLYPKVDEIIMTIFFMKEGGPFSLCFNRGDLVKTTEMLKARFNVIRNTVRPKLTDGKFKCRFCSYAKDQFEGSNQNTCEFIRGELLNIGMDKVVAKYGKEGGFTNYGEGGGRVH